MDPLMIAAAIILILLVFLAVFVFVDLAALPGRIAQDRGSPHVEAITVLGVVGLLAGGILWPVALAWAYLHPDTNSVVSPSGDDRAAGADREQISTGLKANETEALA